MKKCNIGLIGAGNVGKGLIEMIADQKINIQKKLGIDLEIVEIATRTPSKLKNFTTSKLSDQYVNVTTNPDIDIVVELIGGTDTALEVVLSAIENGKTVITANKALISEKGSIIFPQALNKKVEIGYEAAVAGAIPIIRTIRNGLSSNSFEFVAGILNGTTNFILTKMEMENLGYLEALKLAQDKGYAEADPTFDVEGIDVAHKISILSNLAFGKHISVEQVETFGITKISALDIQNALKLGFRIKLLGIGTASSDGKILCSVQPVLIPLTHPLANVMNENNAVYYKTLHSGPGMLTGKGAGSHPTASAVLSDIIYYFLRRESESTINPENNIFPEAEYGLAEASLARYYLRFTTVDKPGVLAEISRVLGNNLISISSMQQDESIENELTNVVILTHEANVGKLKKSIQEIDKLTDFIKEQTVAFPLMENI
ncbi:homoserine dehydrogenase [Leptospira sp. GIMC2001]|uniref:homoserine dehydrogenase n=1 Tax=Leptospira sp. GIMC2001 TaxID=1513297 RepID=UPI002349BA6B|nr:homoserine dehydrogenase [Leptospira sp. GIMC2001]WCL49806.1 homoserine dehydrogenase [Leptospira sp. GIMC2001]